MSYTLLATKQVDKKLNRLHQLDRKKVFKIFSMLKTGPFPKGANLDKTQKSDKSYRNRIGDIRVIYAYNPHKKEIVITDLGYRGNVYQGH